MAEEEDDIDSDDDNIVFNWNTEQPPQTPRKSQESEGSDHGTTLPSVENVYGFALRSQPSIDDLSCFNDFIDVEGIALADAGPGGGGGNASLDTSRASLSRASLSRRPYPSPGSFSRKRAPANASARGDARALDSNMGDWVDAGNAVFAQGGPTTRSSATADTPPVRRLDTDPASEPPLHRRSSAVQRDRVHSQWRRSNAKYLAMGAPASSVYEALSAGNVASQLSSTAQQNISVYETFATMAVSSITDMQLKIYSEFCRSSLL